MKPSSRAQVAALMALLAGVCPRPAQAIERHCPGIAVEGDTAFRSQWPGLLQRIRSEFSVRPDVDACAQVTLHHENDSRIGISVVLPDGRAAFRSALGEDEAISALQALLLVPERPRPTSSPDSEPVVPAPRPAPPSTQKPGLDQGFAPPPGDTTRKLGIELSIITGARVGDGQFGAGAGVLSFLELHGWLIGFEGRADGYRPIDGGDPETALELGVLAGRRFDLGRVAVDLTAGPAVAMTGMGVSRIDVARMESATPKSSSSAPQEQETGPVPRLLLGARVGFSPRSVFRTFLGVDGEVGPGTGPENGFNTSGRLPEFAIGLALGATVGTP
jgi:hypothetical protein